MLDTNPRTSVRRFAGTLAPLLFISMAGTLRSVDAQVVAGQNVNMVSGTEWPGGDPFLQRQNEPSLAVSSRNPLHLVAGANDYRTVDLPTEPGSVPGTLSGDAWLGVFKSFDGGLSWQSTLLPGYPQDNDLKSAGLNSPLKAYSAAADPTVRAGANGLVYYSGMAFNRGTNIGAVFLSRFFDQDDKENGDATDPSQGDDPVHFIDTTLIDTGTSGQFIDKPWIAVDIPRNKSGATTCSFTPIGGTAQSFVGGNVYMTWSRFTGSTSTKIMFARSFDCGKTWSNPIKLSESNSINQGTNIAVDPLTGTVYVTWRRFATSSAPDAILVAKSTDFGKTFASKNTVQVATITPLDQGTTGTQFRTNALPSIAVSVDSTGKPWVHVAWAQRNPQNSNFAQIVVATSPDGLDWTIPPVVVDGSPIIDDGGSQFSLGNQFMPQVTFSQGRLMVLYYDQRLDHTLGFYVYQPGNPALADGLFQGNYTYKLFRNYTGDPPAKVFTLTIDDAFLTERRHTIDLRVAEALPDPKIGFQTPSFSSTSVSQYRFGLRNVDVTETPTGLDQLQDNPPNLPLFAQGTVPFLGDYIDIAGQNIVPDGKGGWTFNTTWAPAPVFYATWTDNRDVVPPRTLNALGFPDWTKYTPPGSTISGVQSVLDPSQTTQPCVQGNEGMRNQNIYSSRITEGLLVGSPQNIKPLSTKLQRAFIVTLQNVTGQQRTFHMAITSSQPPGGWASFTAGTNQPAPASPLPPSPVVTNLDVTIEAHAGAARPVFATSNTPGASITVNVTEASGLSGSIVFNPEGTPPSLLQPDGTSVDIAGFEVYTPSLQVWDQNSTNPFLNIGNPDLSILNIGNLNIGNLNIGNADPILNIGNLNIGNLNIGNLNIGNTDPANLNIGNLNIGNVTYANLNIGNLNIGNLNIGNLNIGNTPVSDSSYAVTNSGNTSHSYRVALYGNNPNNNTPVQLIVTKNSTTPTSVGCTLQSLPQGVVVTTVNNAQIASTVPDATNPDITDSSVTNATVSLKPGETVFVTLRAALPPDQMAQLVQQLTPVVTAHGANTNGIAPDFAMLLSIQTTSGSLPAAVVGVPYNNGNGYQFQAVGGTKPFAWIYSGSLPAGLTLSPGGLLYGTPSAAGSFTFSVTAIDGSPTPETSTQTITMTVSARATSTTVAFSSNPVTVQFPTTVTATVADVQGAGTASSPSGLVTFSSSVATDNFSSTTCALSPATSATSSCSVTLTPSTSAMRTITASYGGSTVHAPSSSNANLTASYYNFNGFLSPLSTAGTLASPSFSGTANYGSAEPLKYQLRDSSGNFLTSLSTTTLIQAVPYKLGACSGQATGTPLLLYSPTSGATGGSTFRYDTSNNQFIFNWDTSYASGAGCYEVELMLSDGSSIKATTVQLK
jgi:hypothetical protein